MFSVYDLGVGDGGLLVPGFRVGMLGSRLLVGVAVVIS